MVKMSRKELHMLVWLKPMTNIAREIGVRDQHIAQACDAYDIARPRPGHWQRVQYGKVANGTLLSSKKYPFEEMVLIGPVNSRDHRTKTLQASSMSLRQA
ncbi:MULTISPECIES: hypothetical protein [unclassified Mesorhizobium]|uniref:hypothetical protein n=1 Tax=unclassified Mesorhizobium TaxID=325217 RepID=UPI001128E1C0|nr:MULTISPECIES: hypothetical protein [unclassified Mesorhizobium]MBZ9811179.1 hypothetical protein [Mesorhizobium sp. ESP-6-2]TPM25760.1 hypothetical protein FJ955_22050 [Mesorhizobium sp. B2-2-2]